MTNEIKIEIHELEKDGSPPKLEEAKALKQELNEQECHCLDKIVELTSKKSLTTRDIFQIGYNIGRLQEMCGDGREAWWDVYKDLVEKSDWDQLRISIEHKRQLYLSI